MLLFALAFGLSTDYGVFLLSRIKEARDHGRIGLGVGGNRARAHRADRHGRGAPVRIAIGAFATSEIIFIKENGVGTALAVLIDATIIRRCWCRRS